MPGRESVQPLKWVLITAAGFIFFLAAAVVFSIYSDKLNVISTPVYFFLLVMIALIAAGFLFGALRSHARYSGKAYNGTLELGGPVIVLVMIVYLGFKFKPTQQSFIATINVFSADSGHAPVPGGQLDIYYGTAKISKPITNGQAVVHELPVNFKGKEVTVIPAAEGYAGGAQKLAIPVNDEAMNLYIAKVPDTVVVTGIIINKAGKPVMGAVVVFADGLVKTVSDDFGNFKASLPFKDGAETPVRVYRSNDILFNNLVRVSHQVPLTLQIK